MEKRQVTLHLGMSKTGSTFLQKVLFPKLQGIYYQNQPLTRIIEGGPFQGLLARAFKRSPLIWGEMGTLLLKEIFEGFEPGNLPKKILLSDQSAGPAMTEHEPYLGSYWEKERKDPSMLSSHIRYFSEELKKWGVENVRVLLVFRRQDEWIASKYAQRSDRLKKASQIHFEERIRYTLSRSAGYYADGIVLDYDRLYRQLSETVGARNLMMVPFEWLRDDQEGFLSSVSQFVLDRGEGYSGTVEEVLNSSENQRKNVRSVSKNKWELRQNFKNVPKIRLRPGRLFSALGFPSKILLSKKAWKKPEVIVLKDSLRKEILNVYKESNSTLADKLGMDLSRYGYY